ncbi:MAG: hypothetical protein ACRDY7_00060, partial [Acidimicrobiia bacterium]
MRALPLAEQSEFVDAFAASLVVVFRLALPIMLGAFVLTWFVREIPLRSGSVGVVSPLAEAAGEPEPAANTNVNGARSPAGRGGGDGRASAGPSSGRRRRR